MIYSMNSNVYYRKKKLKEKQKILKNPNFMLNMTSGLNIFSMLNCKKNINKRFYEERSYSKEGSP